jgi:Icc-related predicted phosphoesterase
VSGADVTGALVRVAAVGDIHLGVESAGRLRPAWSHLGDHADVLLLAGDLTRCGSVEEMAVVAGEVRDLPVPVIAVLGNHDHHAGQGAEVTATLRDAGVTVLEGDATVVRCGTTRVGVAGVKGFGGGFAGACGSEFGEPEMKAFMAHSRERACALEQALDSLDTDVRIALLHYAPAPDTVRGEHPEIFPFLGSYLLGEAIDCAGADLVVHGHAHRGTERGVTPAGTRVRNVAQPLIGQAYKVFDLPVRVPLRV